MSKPIPELSTDQTNLLLENSLQWSLANGLVMYPPNFENYSVNNAPITLFPTPIPKKSFQNALDIQRTYNELYSTMISKESGWLIENIEKLSQFDQDFTGKLYQTYVKVLQLNDGKVPQPLSLGLFRSDYMIDAKEDEDKSVKQIEFNAISVSFGGLSSKVGQLHNYLNKSGYYDNSYSYKYYDDDEIPVSKSTQGLAEGLAKGNYYYNQETDNTKTVVLFIVQPQERNTFDQRLIEYELLELHGIKSYRLTLEQVLTDLTVNSGKLYIKSTMDEISVVYLRSGYAPSDYEVNPQNWDARLFLENNLAIKCPSILTQLSGTKKIQQVLTNEGVIKQLLPLITEDDLNKILSTFVKIHPMDDSEEGKLAKKLAFELPENYVLKPQREGGGNNIYKEEIPKLLKLIPEKDWEAYILMELIDPSSFKNKVIRNNEIFHEDIISELGIFGSVLFDESNGDIKFNDTSGWLLRSKFSSSNEGGVAAGFGCVDSVYLY